MKNQFIEYDKIDREEFRQFFLQNYSKHTYISLEGMFREFLGTKGYNQNVKITHRECKIHHIYKTITMLVKFGCLIKDSRKNYKVLKPFQSRETQEDREKIIQQWKQESGDVK